MNNTTIFSLKNYVRISCILSLFLFANPNTVAQSKEDPILLKKKIARAKSDNQKVELLLALSTYYLTKPGEFKEDLDNASIANAQAKLVSDEIDYKTGKGKTILLEAQILREKGDSKMGLVITNNALAYAKKNNLPVLQADVYKELCAYKGYETEDVKEKIKYLEMAVPLYKRSKAYKKQADALKDLGDYYGSIEENQKALQLLENALALYKSINYKELQGIYTLMSDNYGILQNTQLSLQYALMAEKTAEEVNDNSYQLCTIYNHLALAYYDLLKYDLAFANFEKALKIAIKNKNVNDIKLLTQQGKLQKIQIKNDRVIRYVFIGSVAVLLLFLTLLYNQFRLKKKNNELLEIKRQEINEQNELNKKMLIEKEWLLKEIHHRVKNNLQIVISLLNTQSAYLDNEDALMAIQNSQHRMHAMSLIHQKLYQSDNLANIDMSWYIFELISYMKECFDTDKNINFVLDTEKVYLDVAQAVPLGLIINEAINNAIKYAFPEDRKGNVNIKLNNTGENNYTLIIADNGIGLPENFEDIERNSLGMNLMMGLTDQIDGVFEMKNDDGLKIKITFTRNTEFEGTAENEEII